MSDNSMDRQYVQKDITDKPFIVSLKLARQWDSYKKIGFRFIIIPSGKITKVYYILYPSVDNIVNYSEVFGEVVNFIIAWNFSVIPCKGGKSWLI